MVTTPDAEIPTISTGLPNVATGHCAKTLAILQLSLKDIDELRHIRWLTLVDDDTLLRCVCECVCASCKLRFLCSLHASQRIQFKLSLLFFASFPYISYIRISPLIPAACPD